MPTTCLAISPPICHVYVRRLAQLLLQRTEAEVQPYLQKFLSGALLGLRSDSELKDDCHTLIFQVGCVALSFSIDCTEKAAASLNYCP